MNWKIHFFSSSGNFRKRFWLWQNVKVAKEKGDVHGVMEAAKTACLKLARCVTETANAQFATAKAFSLSNPNRNGQYL